MSPLRRDGSVNDSSDPHSLTLGEVIAAHVIVVVRFSRGLAALGIVAALIKVALALVRLANIVWSIGHVLILTVCFHLIH